jgi:integrase
MAAQRYPGPHRAALIKTRENDMASISRDKNGRRRILFTAADGSRKQLRLGKVTQRAADTVKLRIEALVSATITGHSLDDATSRWVSELDKTMAEKLAKTGLIARREFAALEDFVTGYIDSRTDVESETRRAWRQVRDRLVASFGATRSLKGVSKEDAANWRQELVNEGLADATVRKYTGYVKHFFSVAVERDLLSASPFCKLVSGSVGNDDRQCLVSLEATYRLIDKCPNSDWRLIVALSRFGGLRCPSEHLKLRWCDIDWEHGLMTVTSPKTKKQGKPKRLVPIFDELRPFLEDSFDQAEPGAEFVLSQYRSPSGAYIRKHLEVLIERAGLTQWPRITHNLRASRQTELERNNPTHVVCAIMGNTPAVAHRHYLQTSVDDLLKAAGKDAEKAAQNPAQYTTELGRMASQTGFQQPVRKSFEPSTVPQDTTQCEGERKGVQNPKAGVDGNRTHQTSFQRSRRV